MKLNSFLNVLFFLFCFHFLNAATYTVINTNDSGAGSLRQAILDANTTAGADNIFFTIPGAGVHTIMPTTALPIITEEVVIDGSTQPGAICPTNLLIVLNGSLIGANIPGLVLNNASNSIIKGLVVNNFQINASANEGGVVVLDNSSNCDISCNIIGLDNTGTTQQENGRYAYGLHLTNGSNNNQIGGALVTDRNVFSAHRKNLVIDNASEGNTIQGNYIGTNLSGNAGMPATLSTNFYGYGIYILYDCVNTKIGGDQPGEGNLISGNYSTIHGSSSSGDGIYSESHDMVIQGNLIGLDATGSFLIGNADPSASNPNGTQIFLFSNNVLIGGATTGARNVLAGTKKALGILGFGTNIVIQSNYISTDTTGMVFLGNLNGIVLYDGNNIIGGTTAIERNVVTVDNNGTAIKIYDNNNTIQGNYIGTDATGMNVLGSPRYGIEFGGKTDSYNLIGGDVAGAGNLISNYTLAGIKFTSSYQTSNPYTFNYNNTIQGNLIGTDITGNTILGGGNKGIEIKRGKATLIGGSTVAARNVIAGNINGIDIADSCQIIGNHIGIGLDGMTALPNVRGIDLLNSIYNTDTIFENHAARDVLIKDNVISGNSRYGIHGRTATLGDQYAATPYLFHNPFKRIVIVGNIIGLDSLGTTIVSNGWQGIFFSGGIMNSRIGGPLASDRNIISGNGKSGIEFSSHHNTTNPSGLITLLISEFDTIQNNFIGTDITGTIAMPNMEDGISFQGEVNRKYMIDNNVISANNSSGIFGQNSYTIIYSTLINNKIGTDVSGANDLGNGADGIYLDGGSISYPTTTSNNIFGLPGQGNIIAYNAGDAIDIQGYATADSNIIRYNSMFCNTGLGINLNGAANINKTPPVITYLSFLCNGVDTIRGSALSGDLIDLYYDDNCAASCQGKDYITTVVANGSGLWEYIGNLNQNTTIAATATDINKNTSQFSCSVNTPFSWVVSNDSSICLGGGAITLTASGAVSNYLWSPGGATTSSINITPTDTTTYTVSGFDASNCLVVSDSIVVSVTDCTLPVELLYFSAQPEDNDKVKLIWATISEINNDFFTIERSVDGVYFEEVSIVQGAGNSLQTLNYFDYDFSPYRGLSYYRLKQTDFDGLFSYSNIVAVNFNQSLETVVYPNPTNGIFNIDITTSKKGQMDVNITNVVGQQVLSLSYMLQQGQFSTEIDLSMFPSGMYIIEIKTEEESFFFKEMLKK